MANNDPKRNKFRIADLPDLPETLGLTNDDLVLIERDGVAYKSNGGVGKIRINWWSGYKPTPIRNLVTLKYNPCYSEFDEKVQYTMKNMETTLCSVSDLEYDTREGYTILNWLAPDKPYDLDGTYTFSSDVELSANWQVNKYTLRLITDENNSRPCINGVLTASSMFDYGQSVPISVDLNTGIVFCFWKNDGLTSNLRYIDIGTKDLELCAQLGLKQYICTVGTDGRGGGSVKVSSSLGEDSLSVKVYHGHSVLYTATPNEGYTLGGWSDGTTAYPATNNPWTINNVTGNLSLYAWFTQKQYLVKASSDGRGTATVDGETSKNVYHGTQVTFRASPSENRYRFSNWSNGSTSNPYNVVINSNTELVASFVERSVVVDSVLEYYRGSTTEATAAKKTVMDTPCWPYNGWSHINSATYEASDKTIWYTAYPLYISGDRSSYDIKITSTAVYPFKVRIYTENPFGGNYNTAKYSEYKVSKSDGVAECKGLTTAWIAFAGGLTTDTEIELADPPHPTITVTWYKYQ